MNKELDIDYSDKSIYAVDSQLPLPERDLTPEELEGLIVSDIHSIYQLRDAV